MIKTANIRTGEYSIIWSQDPALALPEDEKERARVLELAQDTGDWTPLLSGNEPPTVFTLAHLPTSHTNWWTGESAQSSVLGRPLSETESTYLLVRLALRKVENFGSIKVERENVGRVSLVKASVLDEMVKHAGGDLIAELFNVIIKRATTTLRPKSS